MDSVLGKGTGPFPFDSRPLWSLIPTWLLHVLGGFRWKAQGQGRQLIQISPLCANTQSNLGPLSGVVNWWSWRNPYTPIDSSQHSSALSSPPPLSLQSKFTVPASCKWHFSPAGNVNPVRSIGLRHAYQKYIIRWGLDRGWRYCAVHAGWVMNNENSMDWRETQLTGRGLLEPPFHSAYCDTQSSWEAFHFTQQGLCLGPARAGWWLVIPSSIASPPFHPGQLCF